MLIVVSGKKRSGKDTFYNIVRNFVEENYPGIPCQRFAFADKVKDYAKTYFSVDSNNANQDKESYRWVLQGIGQMLREEVSKEFWIDIVEKEYNKFSLNGSKKSISVVTDARYLNEIQWAYGNKDARVVRIERPSLSYEDSHASETEIDGYTFPNVILNNGIMEDYKKEVIAWIKPLMKELE